MIRPSRRKGKTMGFGISTSHDMPPFLVLITRKRHRSWVIPWCLRWAASLLQSRCLKRHREHHVMGLPTAGRKLWYPVFCTRCGCRYEIEREYRDRYPAPGSAYVRLAAFERHHGING